MNERCAICHYKFTPLSTVYEFYGERVCEDCGSDRRVVGLACDRIRDLEYRMKIIRREVEKGWRWCDWAKIENALEEKKC